MLFIGMVANVANTLLMLDPPEPVGGWTLALVLIAAAIPFLSATAGVALAEAVSKQEERP